MMRQLLIDKGVKNLREFGYPNATADNILTKYLFRQFFRSMLVDDDTVRAAKHTPAVEAARVELLAEIDAMKESTQ